mmetsp:Transcript_40816/g.107847  ORF Transcript_40816/g.107847 Transcript_40816/m.107847 type:complete len:280 (-) Transcript_40816:147-986(-)
MALPLSKSLSVMLSTCTLASEVRGRSTSQWRRRMATLTRRGRRSSSSSSHATCVAPTATRSRTSLTRRRTSAPLVSRPTRMEQRSMMALSTAVRVSRQRSSRSRRQRERKSRPTVMRRRRRSPPQTTTRRRRMQQGKRSRLTGRWPSCYTCLVGVDAIRRSQRAGSCCSSSFSTSSPPCCSGDILPGARVSASTPVARGRWHWRPAEHQPGKTTGIHASCEQHRCAFWMRSSMAGSRLRDRTYRDSHRIAFRWCMMGGMCQWRLFAGFVAAISDPLPLG